MALKVGDKVYLIAHAYYHYLGEIAEVLGMRQVALKDASRIVASVPNDIEELHRTGVTAKTTTKYVGNVPSVSFISAEEWRHDLPRAKK